MTLFSGDTSYSNLGVKHIDICHLTVHQKEKEIERESKHGKIIIGESCKTVPGAHSITSATSLWV